MVTSVVVSTDFSVYILVYYHVPPVIIFPFEQSTIFIIDGIIKVAGFPPIAVTTKL